MARPKTPLISRQSIIEAALKLIDEEGLSRLSLKRLAAELGVHESSVYYHYRYKKDILTDVLLLVLSDFTVDSPIEDNWKLYIYDAATTYLHTMLAHPEVIPLLTEQRPRTFGLERENQTAAILLKAGFPPEYVLAIREHLEALTIGALQFAHRNLFDELPGDLPELNSIVAAADRTTVEDRFLLALNSYLDGLERQLESWTAASVVKPAKKTRRRTPAKSTT